MKYPILGLHHVTATVAEAQPDLDFYLELLGLRLLKKTVNFDNHNVFHFYYGDERGTPGTIWTTFPYAGWGVPPGRHGEGQITRTTFSVPATSLDFWRARLRSRDVVVTDSGDTDESIIFSDPSGLQIELRASSNDPRVPWRGGGIGAETAIRGLDRVTLTIRSADPTVALLTEVLGFHVVDEPSGRVRLAIGSDQPGRRVDLVHGTSAPPARNGLGTVHHVALAITSAEEQLRLREELIQRGLRVTEVLDRQYFRSIYFREPGGVLLEVATIDPGFTVDEPLSDLGRELKLPPWEEPNRTEIEGRLPVVTPPLAAARR